VVTQLSCKGEPAAVGRSTLIFSEGFFVAFGAVSAVRLALDLEDDGSLDVTFPVSGSSSILLQPIGNSGGEAVPSKTRNISNCLCNASHSASHVLLRSIVPVGRDPRPQQRPCALSIALGYRRAFNRKPATKLRKKLITDEYPRWERGSVYSLGVLPQFCCSAWPVADATQCPLTSAISETFYGKGHAPQCRCPGKASKGRDQPLAA